MDRTQEILSSFAASLSYSALHPETVRAAKLRLIDSVGCAYGAFNEPPIQAARRLASRASSKAPARVLGTDTATTPELAAFANTLMIRYLDFNDATAGRGPHPSDLFGATLAVCESLHADGKRFITASTVAYEIHCRLGIDAIAMGRGGKWLGWEYTTFTVMAAALGAGNAMGLGKGQMAHALSLAVVPHCAMLQTRMGEVTEWKAGAAAEACRNGIFAALLAQEGFAGPDSPIEGRHGLWNQVTGPFELEPFGGPGRPFLIEKSYFKYWPVYYHAQLPVEAALELRKRAKHQDVQSVVIGLFSPKSVEFEVNNRENRWRPQTRETADHSMPFCTAAAYLDGEVTLDTYSRGRFLDPDVVDFMGRLDIRVDPECDPARPNQFRCRLTVVDKSGARHEALVEYPKGHIDNPMTEQELEEKFFKLAERVIPRRQAQRLLERLWRLEELPDIAEVLDLAKA